MAQKEPKRQAKPEVSLNLNSREPVSLSWHWTYSRWYVTLIPYLLALLETLWGGGGGLEKVALYLITNVSSGSNITNYLLVRVPILASQFYAAWVG